jgi:Zn-dependent M28 family amino/carboxypeptidase
MEVTSCGDAHTIRSAASGCPRQAKELLVPRLSRPTIVAAALAAGAALAVPLSTAAVADPATDSARLEQRVTVDGVMRHLEELQAIADANRGVRAAGTTGFDESSDYVASQLRRAGYDVTQQQFSFDFFEQTADPVLEQTVPEATTYVEGIDFATMTFSGSGDVTAPVQAVDLVLAAPETSTSGCEAADFDGFTAGNVALIQRGTCTFADKATNAVAAGAMGVVVFNQGNGEDRSGLLNGTLGGDVVDVPVVGTTFALGQDLADPGTEVHLFTETLTEPRTTTNVIAETPGGDPRNVVMLGAHLDSVAEGPGIEDNGSGSATILEVARQMAGVQPVNKVRFAWWSAEELGLVGSTEYVDSLTPGQLNRIALYLNFDMIASPNYIRGVYDGDGSSFGQAGPAGSDAIEAMFDDFFTAEGLPFQGTAFDGRSDYQAFIDNGVPSGGLFTGADEVKTEAEVARYGGVAGEILDPCYHQACDSMSPVADGADGSLYRRLRRDNGLEGNISTEVLETNADAIAHAVMTYAFDTSSVTGKNGS